MGKNNACSLRERVFPLSPLVSLLRSCFSFQLLLLLSFQLQDTVLEKRERVREREGEGKGVKKKGIQVGCRLSFVSSSSLPLCPQKLIGRKLDVSLIIKWRNVRSFLLRQDVVLVSPRSTFVLVQPELSFISSRHFPLRCFLCFLARLALTLRPS